MKNKIVIILASERSGTNLLRVLLGNHKDLDAPVAVHFFNTFKDIVGGYGDLNKKENAVWLMSHFLKSANHEYTNWELEVSPESVVDEFKVDSFASAFDAIYKEQAKKKGLVHYVVKDNEMFKYAHLTEELNDENNKVYYIHLYRDPRDHVVSWMKTPLFLHTPYDAAFKWNKEQNMVKDLSKDLDIFKVSYEDLISDTKSVMEGLLTHLELEVDENCFQTRPDNKESQSNLMWKNLSKPVIKENKKKYIDYLSKKDLKIVETLCKKNMKDLGYKFDTSASWKDYFDRYKNKELPRLREENKEKNRPFFEEKMKHLKSKLELLKSIEDEVKAKEKN